MTINILLKKLYLEKKEFVAAKELHLYSKALKVNYDSTINYLIRKGYIVRIFRGIFYLKSLDEVKLGSERYSYIELVARGLELKGIKEWYFGLHSALKLNGMTHEYFGVDEIMSPDLFRAKSIEIAGHNFKFHKISKKLFGFGTVKDGVISYSDREKTVLDFIYIWRYNGIPKERIISDMSDWAKGINREKIGKYAKRYPKAVADMLEEVLD
jgi:predicted transcriptional regulator of viral defense system